MDKYILVKGDVSGIQDFIYNVNSKGAAQSLKSRSFFIKILLNVVMKKVFDDLGITDVKTIKKTKISTSGGNFFLKLNNNEEYFDILDGIQLVITKSLQFTGLNMILTYVESQKTYNETLKLLNQKTRERKYNILVRYDAFFKPLDKQKVSNIFGRTNTKGENKKWHGITRQLKNRNNTLIIKENQNASYNFKIFNDKIELLGYEVTFGNGGIKLNNYLESIFPLKKTGTFIHNDDVIKFEELAAGKYLFYNNNKKTTFNLGEKGLNKLGVLAMDVDNLGVALEKVESDIKHKEFDTDLNNFFNKTIESILDKHFKNNGIYTVYTVNAGGDDSLFVGKWNTMIDLAIQIKKEFDNKIKKKYQELSISAAIVIVHSNFPVIRFSQMANDTLKDAKYRYNEKGNISLFDEVFDWDIFEHDLQNMRNDFKYLLNENIISAGLLAKARNRANKIMDKPGIKLSDYWEINYYMRPPKPIKLSECQQAKRRALLNKYSSYLAKSDNEHNPKLKKNYKLIFPFAARLAELDKR